MIAFDEIDSRLKGIEKDRSWLSVESGRKPDSIRVALAPSAPASKRSELLQKALSDAIEREEERLKNANTIPLIPHHLDKITIDCQPDERRNWQAAAKSKGLDLDQWVVKSLNQAAESKGKANGTNGI